MPPKRRHFSFSELLFFLLVLALLVCNAAAGLASGLARGLALTATAVLCAVAEITSVDSLNVFHYRFLRIEIFFLHTMLSQINTKVKKNLIFLVTFRFENLLNIINSAINKNPLYKSSKIYYNVIMNKNNYKDNA